MPKKQPEDDSIQEITPEQLEQLIQSGAVQIITAPGEKDNSAMTQAINNLSAEELVDLLNDYLTQTDIIVQSLSLVEGFNTGEAIFIAALQRTREGLEFTVQWLEKHFSLTNEQAKEEPTEKKTESPNPQKEGKRVVYGAGATQALDDSEQL